MNPALTYLHHKLLPRTSKWHPMLSVFYLTYRCPFFCPFCSDGNGLPYRALSPEILPAAAVREILAAIRKFCGSIVITGGEPLEHPDFDEVMRSIASIRFAHCVLTTRGVDLGRRLESVAGAVTELVVSLDTLDETRADRWIGKSGAHREILSNLDRASAYPRRKYDVIISSVATPENIADLYGVYAYAQKRGYLFAACPQLVGVKAHEGLRSSAAYREFYDYLIAEKRRGGSVQGTIPYLRRMRDLSFFRCRPFTMLVVSPEGDVFYPCLEIGHPAGRIGDWPDLHELRRSAESRFGLRPDCDTRCHSACALGYASLIDHPSVLLQEAWLAVKSNLKRRNL